ncbi:MAG: GNAT family N-acetyltransferase [Lachnospiraceae bacterium]|nr:GNAT family N-acetyltransferase [Lachnospiraceae bacterium]
MAEEKGKLTIVDLNEEQVGDIEDRLSAYDEDYITYRMNGNIRIGVMDDGMLIAGLDACVTAFKILYVSTVFVDKDYRRRGIGAKLMREMERRAFLMGVNMIRLDTFDWQGKDFYEALGYHLAGHYENNEDGYSEFFFYKRLTEESQSEAGIATLRDGENDVELKLLVNKILDNNEIDYYFQPIISAKTGDIVGYEALMRTPKEYGISPLTLLKYAGLENRLVDVERATLFNVMRKMRELKDELGDRKVFINSIPEHYLPGDEFLKLADMYRDLFDRVVIEVTEETDISNDTVEVLTVSSKNYGFQTAVDDFGTGYSNVTNLLKLLPDYVKIDRSLISELQLDPRKQHFVNTIIQFAHDNGFQALAEGVETLEEMNAVISMGADLIQGYFTAKPHPYPLQALPQQLLSDISRANLDMVSNFSRQKVYIVKDEKTLSLTDLSLERYNILLLSEGDITLIGNPDFPAAVSIRIDDHSKCRLTLRDVNIGDVDITPCIDLGKESILELNIEGNNVFTGNGIRVPESAELKLTGDGNLAINPTFTNAYGIGNDHQCTFGSIISEMSGVLEINISGENCICIGGKSSESRHAIDLRAGAFKSTCAASNCVCIGSYQGKTPVRISDMIITVDVRIDTGTMIGSMFGKQDVHLTNASIHIFGAGNKVTGIGSIGATEGEIAINDSSVDIELKGWDVIAVGAAEGKLSIDCRHCKLTLHNEGNNAVGMGTRDLAGTVSLDNVGLDMDVISAYGILFGCNLFYSTMNALTIRRDGVEADRDTWFCVESAVQ